MWFLKVLIAKKKKIAVYKNLSFLVYHKAQWIDSYSQIKTTLQEAIESIVSNTVNKKTWEQKHNERRKTASFCMPTSHAGIIQHKERTFPGRKDSQSLRGKRGWTKHLFWILVYSAMVPFNFIHPDQQSCDT